MSLDTIRTQSNPNLHGNLRVGLNYDPPPESAVSVLKHITANNVSRTLASPRRQSTAGITPSNKKSLSKSTSDLSASASRKPVASASTSVRLVVRQQLSNPQLLSSQAFRETGQPALDRMAVQHRAAGSLDQLSLSILQARNLPISSNQLKLLEMNGVSFLESNLQQVYEKLKRRIDVLADGIRPDDLHLILSRYFKDYCDSLSAYMESRESIDADIKGLIQNMDTWIQACAKYLDILRERDIRISEFSKQFQSLEEENILLKELLTQHTLVGKPGGLSEAEKEARISRLLKDIAQSRKFALHTKATNTSAGTCSTKIVQTIECQVTDSQTSMIEDSSSPLESDRVMDAAEVPLSCEPNVSPSTDRLNQIDLIAEASQFVKLHMERSGASAKEIGDLAPLAVSLLLSPTQPPEEVLSETAVDEEHKSKAQSLIQDVLDKSMSDLAFSSTVSMENIRRHLFSLKRIRPKKTAFRKTRMGISRSVHFEDDLLEGDGSDKGRSKNIDLDRMDQDDGLEEDTGRVRDDGMSNIDLASSTVDTGSEIAADSHDGLEPDPDSSSDRFVSVAVGSDRPMSKFKDRVMQTDPDKNIEALQKCQADLEKASAKLKRTSENHSSSMAQVKKMFDDEKARLLSDSKINTTFQVRIQSLEGKIASTLEKLKASEVVCEQLRQESKTWMESFHASEKIQETLREEIGSVSQHLDSARSQGYRLSHELEVIQQKFTVADSRRTELDLQNQDLAIKLDVETKRAARFSESLVKLQDESQTWNDKFQQMQSSEKEAKLRCGDLHHGMVLMKEENAQLRYQHIQDEGNVKTLKLKLKDLEQTLAVVMKYPDVSLGQDTSLPDFEVSPEYDRLLKDVINSNNLRISLLEQKNNELRLLRVKRVTQEKALNPLHKHQSQQASPLWESATMDHLMSNLDIAQLEQEHALRVASGMLDPSGEHTPATSRSGSPLARHYSLITPEDPPSRPSPSPTPAMAKHLNNPDHSLSRSLMHDAGKTHQKPALKKGLSPGGRGSGWLIQPIADADADSMIVTRHPPPELRSLQQPSALVGPRPASAASTAAVEERKTVRWEATTPTGGYDQKSKKAWTS
ncbi:uncharacterized protein BJ171DRAFT_633921 [Polychytrium aggregatum]|uniref:uncharacterized protein n=1 Tax=Polychytrium aggregatum TaxID=110093 RepID=UPI0022FE83F9|nr:uncharacterized protein BJ171DRAFT_633921 [Polychytrium aggregatum]KAI9208136.1 hypothetical protein BJ171DRAFT_633921 [Polychytrium aggregatum]